MAKIYTYVGPNEIRARLSGQPAGVCIRNRSDVLAWVKESGQAIERSRPIAATFVVDPAGQLRIADRHSEHVACAGGGDVLSAGEMFFNCENDVRVAEVSNQSTGYCPEPQSWPAVAQALDRAEIEHPGEFTTACIFRRCQSCGSRNIVKDEWFHCGVCAAPLPAHWNFG
jgi:hypothetical protein